MSCKKNSRLQLEQGKPLILGLPKVPPLLDPKTRLLIKRISPVQMEERKKQGLCYNYDDKWIPGHRCKSAKLFLLDFIYEVHEPNSSVQITELEEITRNSEFGMQHQEDAKITLYALSGTSTSSTMMVMGRIKQKFFVILKDLGSTHNFIDATLVSHLHIPMDTSQILEVKVANGEVIRTQRVCREVPVWL